MGINCCEQMTNWNTMPTKALIDGGHPRSGYRKYKQNNVGNEFLPDQCRQSFEPTKAGRENVPKSQFQDDDDTCLLSNSSYAKFIADGWVRDLAKLSIGEPKEDKDDQVGLAKDGIDGNTPNFTSNSGKAKRICTNSIAVYSNLKWPGNESHNPEIGVVTRMAGGRIRTMVSAIPGRIVRENCKLVKQTSNFKGFKNIAVEVKGRGWKIMCFKEDEIPVAEEVLDTDDEDGHATW